MLVPDMILVMMSEFVVDWVKHAFITKFNEIPSEVGVIGVYNMPPKTLLLTQLIKNNIRRFDVNRRTSCSHLSLGYSQTCHVTWKSLCPMRGLVERSLCLYPRLRCEQDVRLLTSKRRMLFFISCVRSNVLDFLDPTG